MGATYRLIPDHRRGVDAAEEIERILFNSSELSNFIVNDRPYFAINLLDVQNYNKEKFINAYFRGLMAKPGNVLFHELEQNQVVSLGQRYEIPDSNRLLGYLFRDAERANELQVWRPIGEQVLSNLKENASYIDMINEREQNFTEECWKDQTFCGIFFFNIMVTSAAYQGVTWHMWLYYFDYFVKSLIAAVPVDGPSVNSSNEFPTRAARLIYEAFDTLGGWVTLVNHLPQGSPHRQFESGVRLDNGNIPKSAALALGQCMMSVSNSNNRLGENFCAYLHEKIMRDMRDLRPDGDSGKMRALLISSLISGGREFSGARNQKLRIYFHKADHILQAELSDYRTALYEP